MNRLHGLAFLLLTLLLSFAASCSQRAPQQPILEVTPAAVSLVTGQTTQLEVTRRFPGGPVEAVTHQVTYTTSNRNSATASEGGLVTAGAEAGAVIVRIFDPASDAVATASFNIALARIDSIEVAPSPAVVMRTGETRRFSATARLNNGVIKDVTGQVIWASSNETTATVARTTPDFGLVTALEEGDTTVSATDATTIVQGRTIVFVRGAPAQLKAVRVTPNPGALNVGQTLQFVAVGVFADGSEKDISTTVAWSTAEASRAAIDAKGLATALAAGTTAVTATATPGESTDGGAPGDGGAPLESVSGSAVLKIQ